MKMCEAAWSAAARRRLEIRPRTMAKAASSRRTPRCLWHIYFQSRGQRDHREEIGRCAELVGVCWWLVDARFPLFFLSVLSVPSVVNPLFSPFRGAVICPPAVPTFALTLRSSELPHFCQRRGRNRRSPSLPSRPANPGGTVSPECRWRRATGRAPAPGRIASGFR